MKIFISYRRKDTEKITSDIAKRLKNHFGDDKVVLDTDNFKLGNDFREEIIRHLKSSDVVLIIIGEFWHSTMLQSHIDASEDWVLKEIEMAFQEGKIIIPLFIDNIGMPPRDFLPLTIQDLSNRNGLAIHSMKSQFDTDIRHLIKKVEQTLDIFIEPQPNTQEHLMFLLLNSSWSIKLSPQDGNNFYLCEKDNRYIIDIDIHSDNVVKDYKEDWISKFVGKATAYPVYVKYNQQIIKQTFFIGLEGAKYFIPMPEIDNIKGKSIYYWDIHSFEWQLARHIVQIRKPHKSLEDVAAFAEIEIRE